MFGGNGLAFNLAEFDCQTFHNQLMAFSVIGTD